MSEFMTDEQFDLLMGQLEQLQPGSQEARLIAQGLTLGFGDEIEALIRTPFNTEGYSAIRDDIRRKIEAHQKRAPLEAAGYEMLGAAIPGVVTMGAAAAPSAARTLPQAAMTAAKLGAVEGGLTGIGLSEREGLESLKDAPLAAAGGAVFAPAGYAAGKYAGKVVDKVMDYARQKMGNRGGTVVENEIRRLADATGLTDEEIVQRIASGETLSDNVTLHQSVRGYMAQGGEAEGLIRRQIPERAKQARTEAKEAVQLGLTGRLDENVLKAARLKEDEWMRLQSEGYKRVFAESGEVPPELSRQALEVVQRLPEGIKELNHIYQVEKMVPLFKVADNGAVELARIPSLEDVEIIRRVANEAAGEAYKAGKGTLGGGLKTLEMNLRQDIDNFSPDIKQVRAGYARMSQAREKFDEGFKAFRLPPEQLQIDFARLQESGDPAAIAAFREGVMAQINNKMSIGGSKRFLGKMADQETKEGILFRTVFPEEMQGTVLQQLQKAGKTQLTHEQVLGGSPTALTQQAVKQQNLGVGTDEAMSALAGNPAAAIGIGLKAIKSMAPQLNDAQRRQIVEVLLSEDPAFVQNMLRDRGTIATVQNRVKELSTLMTGGTTAAAGFMGGMAGQEQSTNLLGGM